MQPITRIPFRRPKTIWAVVVGLTLFGVAFLFQVRWEQDITSLLPKKKDSMAALAREWGMMKTVTVTVGPVEPGVGDDVLHRILDQLTDRLPALPGIASVTGRVSSDKALAAVTALSTHAAALYRPEPGKMLTASDIGPRLEALKARLAAPEAMMTGTYLLADPLGLAGRALTGLEAAGAAMGAVVDRGHLLSADRRYGIVIARLDFDPMDVARSDAFSATLDRLTTQVSEDNGGVPIFSLGGVYYAKSTAGVMIRDVSRAFVLTALLVVCVFFLFFRNVRMLPFALLPSAVGIVFALGVMGAFRLPVHAITMGFAATICGISIDYVIHLLFHAADGAKDSEIAMSRALEKTARPMTLGFLTTEAAFAVVAFSGFVGIRQLALFSLVSLPAAFFVALFAVPTLHRFLLRGAPSRTVGRAGQVGRIVRIFDIGERIPRPAVLAAFLLIFVAAAAGASKTVFSGDPRDLGYIDPVLRTEEDTLRGAFPGLFEQAMIVSSGDNLEDALRQNDALYDKLVHAGISQTEIVSLSPFLPSGKTQRLSVSAVRKLLNEETTRAAFEAAGFKAEYFETLEAGIDTAMRAPLVPATFRNTGLAELIDGSLHTDAEGRVHCLTRVRAPDDASTQSLAGLATSVGARLVSERLETKETLIRLQKEIVWMLAVWLVVAVAGVSIVQRSIGFGLRAALPALFGVTAAAAFFAVLGRPMTAVASAGITLVMGLSVDYGIFMLSAQKGRETGGAVAASALTTLAGFGVLAASRIHAMSDIGLIILIGITTAACTSLLLIPALNRARVEKKS